MMIPLQVFRKSTLWDKCLTLLKSKLLEKIIWLSLWHIILSRTEIQMVFTQISCLLSAFLVSFFQPHVLHIVQTFTLGGTLYFKKNWFFFCCFFFFFCGPFLKSALNLWRCCSCFMCWLFWPQGMCDLGPWPGMETTLPALEGRILTTGHQGGPRTALYLKLQNTCNFQLIYFHIFHLYLIPWIPNLPRLLTPKRGLFQP